MQPAIFTSFTPNLTLAEAVPLIRAAGFAAVALGVQPQQADCTTLAGRAATRKLLADNNLEIDSLHAPFPEADRLFAVDEAERRQSVQLCRLALDAAADLDGKVVVIHLIQPYGIPPGPVRDRMVEQGRRSIDELAAHAGNLGVKLALENGQKPDYDQVLEAFLAEFDAPHVGLCYDSGHEHVQGTCFRLLEKYGARLCCVHIHDNRGTDSHLLPYEGTIDWDQFRQVFRRLGFAGHLLLEAGVKNSAFKEPAVFLAEARARAERLLRA